MKNSCCLCGGEGTELYGYSICNVCRSKLGVLTDDTIQRHIALYRSQKKHSYEEEIQKRLEFIEKDFIKKKIKLLHVIERLGSFY